MSNNPMIPQKKKPINKGRAVVSIKLPTKVAIGTAIMVETNPLIAAPIPAMCPIGSIAKARVFPNKKPIAKNCNQKKVNNT